MSDRDVAIAQRVHPTAPTDMSFSILHIFISSLNLLQNVTYSAVIAMVVAERERASPVRQRPTQSKRRTIQRRRSQTPSTMQPRLCETKFATTIWKTWIALREWATCSRKHRFGRPCYWINASYLHSLGVWTTRSEGWNGNVCKSWKKFG